MPENLEQECVESQGGVPNFEKVLGSVSAAVLETMFFEEAVESACEHGWLEAAVSARLSFNGSHTGEFQLSVSPQAARAIAAGFLGLDAEELTETQPGQVILELTNILCGAVMSNLWPDSSLALDPPQLAVTQGIQPGFLHRCFQLPDGPVAISIRVEATPELE